jgi:CxxC-x17-CxxC domain-containing protein
MKNFKRESRPGGGGFERRSSSNRPEMHEATCSDCGKRCEVPFRPTGDKPIYCSQCFGSHGGSSSSGERRSFGTKKMFEATCDSCGKRCELPFKPTGDKPVYCSYCFERGDNTPKNDNTSKNTEQYKEQFEVLNAKLDRILRILDSTKDSQKEEKTLINKFFPIKNKD